MSDSAPVLTQCEGDALTITLNRPEGTNAFNAEMAKGLRLAIKEAAHAP